jgi:hypothetical protein
MSWSATFMTITSGRPAPVDHYPDLSQDNEPHHDHALDHGGVDLDISGVAWGQAVE